MKYSKAFFGVTDDGPFNLDAAVDAYEWVMANPGTAGFVVSKALFDHTTQLMEHNADYIEQTTSAYVSKRLAEVDRGLSRSVSKSAQDAHAIVELIAKADVFTEWERREEVKDQMRDATGRWRVMNRKINHNNSRTPMTPDVALATTGLTARPTRLSPEKLAAYQHDYAQVSRALDELATTIGNRDAFDRDTFVQASYTDGSVGRVAPAGAVLASTRNSSTAQGLLTQDDYDAGRRVDRVVAISGAQPKGATTLSLDALTAMTGSPGFSDFAVGAGGAYEAGRTSAIDAWTNSVTDDQFSTTNRFWRRLGASSKLAREMGGKYLPPKAQLALHVGEWAGKYAPEAEKVIGPTARKSAYRYRGVEKKPWNGYQDEIDSLRQVKGSGRDAHDTLIHGYASETPKGARRPEEGAYEDRRPSSTIRHMKALLPDAGLYELNRKSGTIPPSQGIIIDRSGEVITEAVGYGEDWYLPFNLKNLTQLKGGEYIRTRAYGGLTTEDIYVGLVSGARAVTVVSHSGTFTMEFDEDFRGSRRYNDKAARMVGRYGQVLDAVKSGGITMGNIPVDRREELENEAAQTNPNRDSDGYQNKLNDLLEKEEKEPTLSQVTTNKIKWDALNQHVIDNAKGNNFDEYVQRLEIKVDQRGEDKAAFRAKMANPDSAAVALAATTDVERALRKATAIYAESIDPLRLNGRGYGKAMEAIKQQFPYYVDDVTYTPWTDGTGTGSNDKGYVKPRYIRPASAMAGYFDESITGRGKINADRLNSQNIGARRMNSGDTPATVPDFEEDDPEPIQRARVPRSPERAPEQDPVISRQDATVDLIRALRAQTTVKPGNKLNITGAVTQDFRDHATVKAVLGGTEEEVRARLADPAGQRDIEAALALIRRNDLFDVDEGMWSRSPRVIPLPTDNLALVNNLGVKDFAMPSVPDGENVAFYDAIITPMLNPSYKPFIAALEITPDSTPAEVKAAVKERAANLRGLFQAHKDFRDFKIDSVAGLPTERDLRSEAEDLARIATAYRLRQARMDAEKAATDAAAQYTRVVHTFSDAETEEALSGLVPKADAPDEGAADEVDALKTAAAPYRDEVASMVGMGDIVGQMDKLVARAAAAKRRERLGMEAVDRPMSMVFAGNPGTGKTTVAEKLGGMYYDIGLTSEKKWLPLTKRDLVGATANDIANTTREQLELGKGGVIFIDEAYTLNSDDYGRQVIDELVDFMPKNPDTVFIFAGYPDKMREFREDVNPGLKSRLSTVIDFRDYSAPEMVQIADHMMAKHQYTASPTVKKRITHAIAQIHGSPEYNGNGRDVSNFLALAADAHDERLMEMPHATREQESELATSDVEYAVKAMGLKHPATRRKKAA